MSATLIYPLAPEVVDYVVVLPFHMEFFCLNLHVSSLSLSHNCGCTVYDYCVLSLALLSTSIVV